MYTSGWSQGALHLENETRFRIWAPNIQQVKIRIGDGSRESVLPMNRLSSGYHELTVPGAGAGTRYRYLLDDGDPRPDPASRSQPDGVHAASEVIDPIFPWTDGNWNGLPLLDYVVYELHVGTFTQEGTFDAVISQLSQLKELGITAIELMPVAQFPGERNWGYDGVYPFAAQQSYGGINGLKRLVNAAHATGLAVVLDVVYNHLGPEGNYLSLFAPYFTDTYKTPWGCSLNFDGEHSDEVRRYFIDNALYWTVECHIDALRLDAVHAIIDTSAEPFLRQLTNEVHEAAAQLGRQVFVIAENDRNDPAFARPATSGGIGMDAQWSDDFHHCLHTLLTGEKYGYYEGFGALEQLARAYVNGFVFDGIYSKFKKRTHGSCSRDLEGKRFVICAQNHDQVGNRMLGERLSSLISFEKLKLAAAATLLAPNIPLLFMGEEYGETAPFLYFVSHGDPGLVEAVRKGRREEFAAFHAQGEAPDPQAEETFTQSRLNRDLLEAPPHRALFEYYRELLRLRQLPALVSLNKQNTSTWHNEKDGLLAVTRKEGRAQAVALFHFGDHDLRASIPCDAGTWNVRLYSEDRRWLGNTNPGPESHVSDGMLTLHIRRHSAMLLELV